MSKSFLITTPQFSGCSTIYQITRRASLTRVTNFGDRRIFNQTANGPVEGVMDLPLDITWIILETALRVHFRTGQFESVLRILYSSKAFMLHIYRKCITNLDGEYIHTIISRLSSLFKCLDQTADLLESQPAYEGVPFIPVIHLTGSEFYTDWDSMISWPFGPPFIKPKPRVGVTSKKRYIEIMDVQTSPHYLDEVWMSGIENSVGRFDADFFRQPNIVFSVVYNSTDLDVTQSKAVIVWLRFLRVFLGSQCGLYLGISLRDGFVCYEVNP